MNIGYLKSLVAILKLASIVILIIAYSLGMHAYFSSEYNKGCLDTTITNPTITITTFSSFPTSSLAYTLRPTISSSTSTTERFIISLGPQPSTSAPTDELSGCDKAPILWMERFHLILTGTFIMISAIMFILHVVDLDLLDNLKFRGVDFCYHFFGSIGLIVSSIFMTYTATKIDSLSDELCLDPDNCQLMAEKITSAAFAFIAGIVFITVGMRSFGKKFYQTV